MSRVHARRQSRGRFPQTPRVPPRPFQGHLVLRCQVLFDFRMGLFD